MIMIFLLCYNFAFFDVGNSGSEFRYSSFRFQLQNIQKLKQTNTINNKDFFTADPPPIKDKAFDIKQFNVIVKKLQNIQK